MEQQSAPSVVKTTIEQSFSDLKAQLEEKIKELSSRIQLLQSNQSSINMEVDAVTQSLQGPSASAGTVLNTTASGIADELADCERRKNNLIIYNLPETPDREADKKLLTELSKTVFSEEYPVLRILRMGKKNENKHRPALVVLKHDTDKSFLLSNSAKLRLHDAYKTVYFSPDRTKFERVKYKKLVDELKQRKQNGETNLIIRNNTIINIRPKVNSGIAPSHDQPMLPSTIPIEKIAQN